MPAVLVWLPEDLLDRLRSTLLWRPEIERLLVETEDEMLATIRERRPRLLIFDGRRADALRLVQTVRSQPDTRDLSIAALLGEDPRAAETLRCAGVNVVLTNDQPTPLWDDAFQELVNVPPRRWVNVPVWISLGARPPADSEAIEVVARNISVRGLLIEGSRPLSFGGVLSLFVSLPGSKERLHLVGRVVWTRVDESSGLARQGIEFLGFHGDAMGAIAAFVASDVRP